MEIGSNITKVRQLRMLKGLTIQILADFAGVSKQSVLRLEMGKGIRPALAKDIARVLEVEVEDIATIGPNHCLVALPYKAVLCDHCGRWS